MTISLPNSGTHFISIRTPDPARLACFGLRNPNKHLFYRSTHLKDCSSNIFEVRINLMPLHQKPLMQAFSA
jgi:hypothetical protein